MKVCMISFSDVYSGNATRILNLAKNLSDEVDVELIFDGKKCNHIPKQFGKLKIIFTPYLGNLYITLSHGMIYKLIKCMKKYDIIHCFKPLPSSFIPSYLISKLKMAKLIVDWDDWEGKGGFAEFDPIFLRDFLNSFQMFCLKKADGVIGVTPFLKKWAEKFNPHVYMIPNGADVNSFTPDQKDVKIKIGKKFNHPLIIFVGLLYKSCDLDIVINAMKYVTSKVHAKLIVVGDGPRREEFISLAKKMQVEEDIIFLGYKKRELVPQFLALADVAVLPMKDNLVNWCRSPVKLGEYLAAGKAIVASDVGIVRDIIVDHYNGILTSNDPKTFGNAIVELLEDTNLRKKIGKNARRTAEEKLDWKVIAKELVSVYNEVVGV